MSKGEWRVVEQIDVTEISDTGDQQKILPINSMQEVKSSEREVGSRGETCMS